jgi:hypothetical protein
MRTGTVDVLGNFLFLTASGKDAGLDWTYHDGTGEWPFATSVGFSRTREGRELIGKLFRELGTCGRDGSPTFIFVGVGLETGKPIGIGLAARVRAGFYWNHVLLGVHAEGVAGTKQFLGTAGVSLGVQW